MRHLYTLKDDTISEQARCSVGHGHIIPDPLLKD